MGARFAACNLATATLIKTVDGAAASRQNRWRCARIGRQRVEPAARRACLEGQAISMKRFDSCVFVLVMACLFFLGGAAELRGWRSAGAQEKTRAGANAAKPSSAAAALRLNTL